MSPPAAAIARALPLRAALDLVVSTRDQAVRLAAEIEPEALDLPALRYELRRFGAMLDIALEQLDEACPPAPSGRELEGARGLRAALRRLRLA